MPTIFIPSYGPEKDDISCIEMLCPHNKVFRIVTRKALKNAMILPSFFFQNIKIKLNLEPG